MKQEKIYSFAYDLKLHFQISHQCTPKYPTKRFQNQANFNLLPTIKILIQLLLNTKTLFYTLREPWAPGHQCQNRGMNAMEIEEEEEEWNCLIVRSARIQMLMKMSWWSIKRDWSQTGESINIGRQRESRRGIRQGRAYVTRCRLWSSR